MKISCRPEINVVKGIWACIWVSVAPGSPSKKSDFELLIIIYNEILVIGVMVHLGHLIRINVLFFENKQKQVYNKAVFRLFLEHVK